MKWKSAVKWIALMATLALVLPAAVPRSAAAPLAQEPDQLTCGDSVTCTTAGAAIRVNNSGTGPAIYGNHTSPGWGRYGVRGYGSPGVYGSSWGYPGVQGKSTTGVGVRGDSTDGTGVEGRSTTGWGGYLQAGDNNTPDLVLGGTSGSDDDGTIWSNPGSTASDIVMYSMDNLHIHLDENDDQTASFVVRNGANESAFTVGEDGDAHLLGDVEVEHNRGLVASTATSSELTSVANGSIMNWVDNDQTGTECFWIKAGGNFTLWYVCEGSGMTVYGPSAMAVETSSGPREMYNLGSTGLWFEDFGSGTLVDGQMTVQIDPQFAETVNLAVPYHVFVQVYGDADVYVSNRTPAQFEVRLREGDPGAEFSYRIVAQRVGYENQRLAPVDSPEVSSDSD